MSDGVSEVRKVVHASVAELHSTTADKDQLCQSLNQQLEDFTRKPDEHVGLLYAHSSQNEGLADGSARRENPMSQRL